MGAECNVCGHDMFDECAWCKMAAERDRYRDALEDIAADTDPYARHRARAALDAHGLFPPPDPDPEHWHNPRCAQKRGVRCLRSATGFC